jgi:hypothetical protein
MPGKQLACVAGPQFYGGPDFQAPHKIEGLPRRLVNNLNFLVAF